MREPEEPGTLVVTTHPDYVQRALRARFGFDTGRVEAFGEHDAATGSAH